MNGHVDTYYRAQQNWRAVKMTLLENDSSTSFPPLPSCVFWTAFD